MNIPTSLRNLLRLSVAEHDPFGIEAALLARKAARPSRREAAKRGRK